MRPCSHRLTFAATRCQEAGEQQGSQQQGSGFTPVAAYGGLALGAAALVVALVALLRALRKG